MIGTISYSFGDGYMNKLIAQTLSASRQRNVLIVDLKPELLKEFFVSKYSVDENQVKIWQARRILF